MRRDFFLPRQSLLARTILLLALAPLPAFAVSDSEASGYQEAIQTQMRETVLHTLDEFFTRVGQNKPEKVEVTTNADLDLSQAAPTIRKLAMQVSLTSDLPAEVIREARQELLHMLQGNGYRTAETVHTAKEEAKPVVKLTIDVQPLAHPDQQNNLRELLILGALAAGALAAAFLAGNLLSRGLRRGGGRQSGEGGKRSTKPEPAHYWPQSASAAPGPEVDPGRGPLVDLPPLPRLGAPRGSSAGQLPPLRREQTPRDS